MEVFTSNEFQERWDELINRVENGDNIKITNSDGQSAVIISSDDELMKLYIELNNEAQ